jgi:hypothetical protein
MLKYLVLCVLFVAAVILFGYTLQKVAADPDPTPPSASSAPAPDVPWKLRVIIEDTAGTPQDVLAFIGRDGMPRHWQSQQDCQDFLQTEEYHKSLGGLANYLVKQGYDTANTAVVFACVPDLPAK